MRRIDVKDKLAELATPHPQWEVFRRLGDLTKLRHSRGTFRAVNYESGLLLYCLARKYRPRRILEIGTGRGYGALCLASALEDGALEGEVVTVDTRGYDEPQEWALDDGSGPRVARLSRRQVWEEHVDERRRRRIVQVQATSFEALRDLAERGAAGFDLVYIDGDHTYPVVRHDFYASLLVVRPRRVVVEEIAPAFEAEAIRTDGRWGASPEIPDSVDQAQVLVDSERMARPLEDAFPHDRVARIVDRHRRWPRALSRVDALRTAAGDWLSRR